MHCTKEMEAYSAARDFSKSLSNENDVTDMRSTFRVPRAGEPVALCGSRKRPELNGSRGEVIDGSTDEFGRVAVKLWGSNNRGLGGSRQLLVQANRLQPLLQDGTPAMSEFNQMLSGSKKPMTQGSQSDFSVISAADSAAKVLSNVQARDSDRMVLAPLGRSESAPSLLRNQAPKTPSVASLALQYGVAEDELSAVRADALAALRSSKRDKTSRKDKGRSNSESRLRPATGGQNSGFQMGVGSPSARQPTPSAVTTNMSPPAIGPTGPLPGYMPRCLAPMNLPSCPVK